MSTQYCGAELHRKAEAAQNCGAALRHMDA